MKVISYDIIRNGQIIDTVQFPSTMNEAAIMQLLAERNGWNIRSFHICKLRYLSGLKND